MTAMLTRRSLTATAFGTAVYQALPGRAEASAAPVSTNFDPGPAQAGIKDLEAGHGGRLGVVAVDGGSGRRISYRAGERFPMCSTHKVMTAAAILGMVDRGALTLSHRVPYGQTDLLSYAPITRKNVAAGFMTVDALCAAAIEWSDNTADDLLLKMIGGPAGWTRYARAIGDDTSRLDRFEPELNTAISGDPRDTTTPDAMTRNLHVVLRGSVLTAGSRERLQNWMLDGRITTTLLHAGLPQSWRVADKSGSGENGTRNDIGLILRPKGPPICAAVYYTQSSEPPAARETVIADIGRIIAQTFG